MKAWVQPTEYSGAYPNGWGGYTWLDYDPSSNAFHPGEDYNWGTYGDADLGKPVYATMKGKVVYSSYESYGYGNMIILEHVLDSETRAFVKKNYGWDVPILYSLYAHLNQRLVAVSNTIDYGALIGYVGKSGTQYAHLHFEIYRGDLDLKNEPWRFYPVGWSTDKIKRNWLPAFLAVEKSKTATTPPPADPYKAKNDTLKIAIARLKTEFESELINPSVNHEALYKSTTAKARKIADTGTL